MPPDSDRTRLTAERRALLDHIVAEGGRRRRVRLLGAGTTMVLVTGVLAAVLTVVGERDPGHQLLAAGGTPSTSVVAPAEPPRDPAADPSVGAPVPSSVPPADPGGPAATPPTTSATVAPPASLPGAWAALPPSGVAPRFGGVRVWTGRELLVWGGIPMFSDACGSSSIDDEPICGDPAVFDGVAFDPVANTWRRMAPGPVPGGGAPTQTIPGGAWTGSELVVWGGFGTPVSAAYDPVRDTWRNLPPGPLAGGGRPAVVAISGEVYVVRTGPSSGSGPGAAALDPASGTWRVLPDPPANGGLLTVAAVGGEMVIVLQGPQYEDAMVAALAPSGLWRVVSRFPQGLSYRSAVVAGGRAWVVACRYLDTSAEATVKSVDLATGAVSDRAGPVAECPQLVAAGAEVLALTPVPGEWSPESLRVHQATGDGWRELNGPPAGQVGAATWTGSEVLFWAGCDCGGLGGRAVEGGYRLRL